MIFERNLEELYNEFYKEPTITVTPISVNTKLEDLRSTVDSRAGQGGQTFQTRVSPDGTVQLPAVGSTPAQGLTLTELEMEVDERYRAIVDGIEVTAVLVQRASRFVYVSRRSLATGAIRAGGSNISNAGHRTCWRLGQRRQPTRNRCLPSRRGLEIACNAA